MSTWLAFAANNVPHYLGTFSDWKEMRLLNLFARTAGAGPFVHTTMSAARGADPFYTHSSHKSGDLIDLVSRMIALPSGTTKSDEIWFCDELGSHVRLALSVT